MRELTVASFSEVHAVAFAQHPDFTGEVWPVCRIPARLVRKRCIDVDEFEAVEVGPFAHDFVHDLRVLVGFGAREVWQTHPINGGVLVFDSFHHTVDAARIFRSPIGTADSDLAAGRTFERDPVVFSHHDYGNGHRFLSDGLFEVMHLALDVSAHDALNFARFFLDG